MRRRLRPKRVIAAAWGAAATLMLVLALPATGQTINTLDYWLTQTAGVAKPYACTAGNYSNHGTYSRHYQGAANDCPGLTVYHVTKGESGTNLWSTESYYADSGFVKIIQEVASYSSNPPADCVNNGYPTSCDLTRAFRDSASGWKGIPTVPLSFTSGWSYNHQPYVEETWVTGYRVCYSNNKLRWVNGSGVRIEMYQGPTFTGFLQDRRGTTPPLTWHNVQTIERRDFWGGGGDEERYWYGRWYNPRTSRWEGVGLVKWAWYRNGVLVNQCGANHQQPCVSENRYLVDCNAAVPCWSCPP